ncbi:MAG: PadR family transcriptional regulator [Ardenticatenaceae bacterium]|nr:PadR family transcriptional regulator [Ardenticatenaceae bacterium]MCB8988455.1 PadR family transcriptional regulator [Ardenticatenaceae bacterium]
MKSSLSLELALLGFLHREPMHGYAIHQALSDPAGLGAVWQIKLSLLYALLGKLENAGYITATTEPQDTRPPRKIYQLTPDGARAFLDWVRCPVSHGRSLRLEFLVKLYFARREGPDVAACLLAVQRQQCQDWLATEQEIVADEWANGRHYSHLIHQFRLGQIQAMLDWLDQCEGANL